MKLNSFFCFVLLLLFALAAFAQKGSGVLSGRVVLDGSAVKNAKITIQIEKNGRYFRFDSKADAEGNFKVEGLPDGNYIIWASQKKPEAYGVGSGQLAEGAALNLEIPLKLGNPSSEIRIRENVTVAAGLSQPDSEVSKSVNVVDAQQLRERSEYSFADSLRAIPGLRIQQLGGFGKTANIKMRGLRNQDTAILLDGIRFRDASAISGDASSFISDFTHTNAFRLEILRGSGSSLYGTGSAGGAIDIRTQEPQKGLHGGLTTAFGSLGQKRFRGNISDGFKNFGFSLGISRTIFSEGIDGDDDAHNTNFNARIDYSTGSKSFISGRFFVSDAFVKLNDSPDTLGSLPANTSAVLIARRGINFVSDANDPDNSQKSALYNSQVVFRHAFSENLFFSVNYQGSKTRRKNDNGPLGNGFQFESTNIFEGLINTFHSKLDWSAKNNTLSLGYEYEQEKFGNEGFSPSPGSAFSNRARQSSNTFYLQDQIGLFDRRLQLMGSFRAQFFGLKTPVFSAASPFQGANLSSPPNAYTFDASFAYRLEKTNTKIRGHFGNGYRAPSLYERFGTFFFLGSFSRFGNPDLKPERSRGFDLGIDQFFGDEKVKVSSAYFYTELQDLLYFFSSGNAAQNGYTNLTNAFSRGAEFSLDAKATKSTTLFASYTFTNSDRRNYTNNFFPPINLRSKDEKALGIPNHQFSFAATQRIGNSFFVNFDFEASSSYLAPIFSNSDFRSVVYRFKGQRKGDLTGSYSIPSFKGKLYWRIFGTIENIFGYEYFENGFATAGRTARMGLGLSF